MRQWRGLLGHRWWRWRCWGFWRRLKSGNDLGATVPRTRGGTLCTASGVWCGSTDTAYEATASFSSTGAFSRIRTEKYSFTTIQPLAIVPIQPLHWYTSRIEAKCRIFTVVRQIFLAFLKYRTKKQNWKSKCTFLHSKEYTHIRAQGYLFFFF